MEVGEEGDYLPIESLHCHHQNGGRGEGGGETVCDEAE